MIELESKWTNVECMECGIGFEKRNAEVKRTKRNFCSVDCRKKYNKHSSPKKIPIKFEIMENGCYVCTSHKASKRGYPRIHKKLIFRHIYEEMFGVLNKGDLIRHLCDNKMCINPEHLRKGTQQENVNDAIRNGKFRYTVLQKRKPS